MTFEEEVDLLSEEMGRYGQVALALGSETHLRPIRCMLTGSQNGTCANLGGRRQSANKSRVKSVTSGENGEQLPRFAIRHPGFCRQTTASTRQGPSRLPI